MTRPGEGPQKRRNRMVNGKPIPAAARPFTMAVIGIDLDSHTIKVFSSGRQAFHHFLKAYKKDTNIAVTLREIQVMSVGEKFLIPKEHGTSVELVKEVIDYPKWKDPR